MVYPGGAPLTSIEDMADWLARLLAAMGVQTAAFIGHSQGCLVALEMASRHSAYVDKLCLIAGAQRFRLMNGLWMPPPQKLTPRL